MDHLKLYIVFYLRVHGVPFKQFEILFLIIQYLILQWMKRLAFLLSTSAFNKHFQLLGCRKLCIGLFQVGKCFCCGMKWLKKT